MEEDNTRPGCCRCKHPYIPEDEGIINCSCCRNSMHLQCFADWMELKSSSTPTRSTRQLRAATSSDDASLTPAEKNAIAAALKAECVLVVCQQCQEKADVTSLLSKLSRTANQAAVRTQQLNEKVSTLERGLAQIKEEIEKLSVLPKEEIERGLTDIKQLKQQVKEQEAVPARLTMAEALMKDLQSTAITADNNEWKEVKNKAKNSTPPATPVDIRKNVRDNFKSIQEEELRKRNLLLFNVPEPKTGDATTDKRDDLRFFNTEVAAICQVNFVPEDFNDCLRVSKVGESPNDKIRPVLIKLTEEGARKKKLLFSNLHKFREHQRSNMGPEDSRKPPVSVYDDLTEDQRAERRSLLAEAKSRNERLGNDSHFLWVIRGPSWKMQLKQVEKKRP